MEPVYRYSESTDKPLEIEVTKRTVFLRKNFVKIERYDENADSSITFWTYQEAKMTPDEFNDYYSYIVKKNAINGINDSDNITSLLSGQENGDNNQLIIMEAIADLYDIIASKGGTE